MQGDTVEHRLEIYPKQHLGNCLCFVKEHY